MAFFIYDGMLGWKAKNVDGSSYELGQLAHMMNSDGVFNLPADSPWRADLPIYMDIITYNTDPANVTPPVVVDPYAPSGKVINEEDKLYFDGGAGWWLRR